MIFDDYLSCFLFLFLCLQIREELVYNNIRLYPFDTDEDDEDEVHLNEAIRVSFSGSPLLPIYQVFVCSKSFPLLLWAQRTT
jgi:hypothetical protein